MGIEQQIGIAPIPAVTRVLSQFPPEQLACFIEVAIGLLDLAQPSPDEPDFSAHSDGLPGDPGDHEPAGDDEQGAYVEWTTMRGSQKLGHNLLAGHEDDEEDDPSGQCDEDGINTDFFMALSSDPGCPISDSDYEHDGREEEAGY